MIKNSKNSNRAMSSKNNKSARMGGPGSASRPGMKGIRHGVSGRDLSSTEHNDRMGSMTVNNTSGGSAYEG